MALKAVLTKEEHATLADNFKPLYKSEGDKFVLEAEGLEQHTSVIALQRALDRERGEKGTVAAQLAELKAKFEGLDSEEAREALKKIKDLERAAAEGEIPEKMRAQFDKAVEARLKSLQDDFDAQKKALDKKAKDAEAENQTLSARLEDLTIGDAVRAAATKAGLHDWAVEDAVLHAKTIYKLNKKTGLPEPFENGVIVYGKDGTTPKPVAEWLTEKLKSKPGWVKGSGGGGAENNTMGGAGMGNGANGVVIISRADARNPRRYNELKSAAEKAGKRWEIEPDPAMVGGPAHQ
jgi:hypothetical protein